MRHSVMNNVLTKIEIDTVVVYLSLAECFMCIRKILTSFRWRCLDKFHVFIYGYDNIEISKHLISLSLSILPRHFITCLINARRISVPLKYSQSRECSCLTLGTPFAFTPSPHKRKRYTVMLHWICKSTLSFRSFIYRRTIRLSVSRFHFNWVITMDCLEYSKYMYTS